MSWIVNFLIKIVGAVMTSWGLRLGLENHPEGEWVIGLLAVGLSLLFMPEIKGRD